LYIINAAKPVTSASIGNVSPSPIRHQLLGGVASEDKSSGTPPLYIDETLVD